MIELAPNIFFIRGKNHSLFPYCACLYLKGRYARILIDAGMGGGRIEPVLEHGVDILILSHCHVDHRLTRREIPDVPVWCHGAEEPYMISKANYLDGTGLTRGGFEGTPMINRLTGVFDVKVARKIGEGESIDLGNMTLQVLHTPGHSPGHLAFYIPEYDILFTADVALTPFGPYYGHDFADLDDFIASIHRLRDIKAQTVATGHAGPYDLVNSQKRFRVFEEAIYERDRIILDRLSRPRSLDDLSGQHLIYSDYQIDGGASQWLELNHIEKHLKRLADLGQVRTEGDHWVRI